MVNVLSVKGLSVDDDVDDEGDIIAALFNGVFRNPLMMVSGFTARYHALEKRVTTWPTFSEMYIWQTEDQ